MSDAEAQYWNQFYAQGHPDLEAPSSFAEYCLGRLQADQAMFELGCGNGRDALYFAANDLRVIACDKSAVAIERLAGRPDLARFRHRPSFVNADFATLSDAYRHQLAAVYSRFTLHAVPADEAARALAWSEDTLRPGGRLFIEARSVKGSLYGQGEPVERDAFIHDGHYRRFLRMDELLADLAGLGFTVDEAIESAGLAVYKDDDPVVIRIIATKPR